MRVVDLGLADPYDAPGVFAFLAARAVPGVEVAGATSTGWRHARTARLPSGPGVVELRADRADQGWRLSAALDVAPPDEEAALGLARRMLDLGHDAVTCDDVLARDPHLEPLVRAVPGIRVPGSVDAGELLVRAVVGQQISVVAATGHLGRLAEAAGAAYACGVPGLDRLFPTAEEIVAAVPRPPEEGLLDPERPLRLPRRAITTVLDLAAALATGEIDLDPASLVQRRGIGPWTAAYVAMRHGGDPDVWLPSDVALVAGAHAAGILPVGEKPAVAQRALAARSLAWSPWRSYAVMHLWRVAAGQ